MTGEGRLLGLDVGGRRIGVAISDELGIMASPVRYVERGRDDRADFRELVSRFGPVALVVGLPAGMSGREGPQAKDVRDYADALGADLQLPVRYWDERLTTTMAERTLIAGGRRREQRREEIDALAAAMMLQSYLDNEARRRRSGERP